MIQERAGSDSSPMQKIGPITYKSYIESEVPEVAANALICLIHQTNFLLDQQLRQLEKQFLEQGGFTEKLYHARQNSRRRSWRRP